MKKFCIVMALLLTLLAGCAAAETLQEGKEALKAAKTLDEQLAILNRIADGQVFITCCEERWLDRLEAGKTLRVTKGAVTEG